MKPASPDAKSHSVMFWICVGLSVIIVFTAWLAITKDRLAQDGSAMQREAQGVWKAARSIGDGTQPERDRIKMTVEPLIEEARSNIEKAKQRKRALDKVSPYFEEQIK